MKSVKRLYAQFLPSHYDLSIRIDQQQRRFYGRVTIHGRSPQTTDRIQLHCSELTVYSAKINGVDVPCQVAEDSTISLSAPIPHGDIVVDISYGGNITESMHGLYPCHYLNSSGENDEILVTQLEPHHARELFPCVDEPEAKATYALSITAQSPVLSNMELDRVNNDGEVSTYIFKPTPRMSSYLLAFVVGDLQSIEQTTARGTTVKVHATSSQDKDSMDFALDIAVRCLDFFEEYFGIPYPLKKIDHVAVPDFSAGAMENWGLIIYRERALLVNDTTPQSSKEVVATIIAHELSHQWFGNLVTMKWWDDLWLNESFANLMEYVAIDALHPEWNIWLEYATKESTIAVNRDILKGVQPVACHVRHPDEITSLFDPAIVYAKGSRLLRMLHEVVGDDAFRRSIEHYFNTFAYGSTSSDDLWRSFETCTHIDIKSFMVPWLTQAGLPVVTVSKNDTVVSITQSKLEYDLHDPTHLWPIPLTKTASDLPYVFSEKTFALPSDFTLRQPLNRGGVSHFVTLYDDDTFAPLVDAIGNGAIAPADRVHILHDYLSLARTGKLGYPSLIDLLDVYSQETDQAVWTVIQSCLFELQRFCATDDERGAWSALVLSLVNSAIEEIGLQERDTDSDAVKKLRSMLLTLQIKAQHSETISQFSHAIDATSLNDIGGEMRSVYLHALSQEGSAESFSLLTDVYTATTDPQFRQELSAALASTQDQNHISLLLYMLSDTTKVKPQDTTHWFAHLMRNPSGKSLTWDWMVQNWSTIKKRYKNDTAFDAFPRYAANGLSTAKEYEDYTSFFGPMRGVLELDRAILIGTHELHTRSSLISSQRDDVFERTMRYIA